MVVPTNPTIKTKYEGFQLKLRGVKELLNATFQLGCDNNAAKM